jgi:hypothetical protein
MTHPCLNHLPILRIDYSSVIQERPSSFIQTFSIPSLTHHLHIFQYPLFLNLPTYISPSLYLISNPKSSKKILNISPILTYPSISKSDPSSTSTNHPLSLWSFYPKLTISLKLTFKMSSILQSSTFLNPMKPSSSILPKTLKILKTPTLNNVTFYPSTLSILFPFILIISNLLNVILKFQIPYLNKASLTF